MFTIEPGGYRVTHDVGKRITVRPDCIIVDGGLFKGFPQSWRLTGRRL
jgi:hypothetical protein